MAGLIGDHLRHQELGIIADRLDSEMLRGFFDRWRYRQTFAIEDLLLRTVASCTSSGAHDLNFGLGLLNWV